jgi:5'(3')-deoxyribonucleotidase
MKNRKTIFLDMDGVLVDIFTGIEKRFNLNKGFLTSKPYPCLPNSPDIAIKLLMTEEDFWSKKANSISFWENLPKYSWSDAIIIACLIADTEDVFILTSPSKTCTSCSSGKVAWLNRYYPYFVSKGKIIIATKKDLLANKKCILIDDTIKKCERFRNAGGEAILFPHNYNKNYFSPKERGIHQPKNVNEVIDMIRGL